MCRMKPYHLQISFCCWLILWRSSLTSPPYLMTDNVGCTLPESWHGAWFQPGVPQPIYITHNSVTSKGTCVQASGHRFVVHNREADCYQCLIFYEKHPNIIHYKESFCSPESRPPELSVICGHVTIDRPLFALLRIDYRPIECPLRGPFSFTYRQGHSGGGSECSSQPRSRLDRCLSSSRMTFAYRRCETVAGTKDINDDVECVAVWREGSARYLITRRVHEPLIYPERAFRCTIFQRAAPHEQSWLDFRLAVADEASCRGLLGVGDGARQLKLVSAPPYTSCQLPSWLVERRRWISLDGATDYRVSAANTSLLVTPTHGPDGTREEGLAVADIGAGHEDRTRIDCTDNVETTETHAILITRFTNGCRGGFRCLRLFRRDTHVLEMQLGVWSFSERDACSELASDASSTAYQALVAADSHGVSCPNWGAFRVEGVRRNPQLGSSLPVRVIRDLSTPISDLQVGCSRPDTLALINRVAASSKVFSCCGSWTENDTSYMVATLRDPGPSDPSDRGAGQLCFVSRQVDIDSGDLSAGYVGGVAMPLRRTHRRLLQVSTVVGSCQRDIRPGYDGLLAINATALGGCDISTGCSIKAAKLPLMISLSLAALIYVR